MKANELRIGNFFYDELDNIHKVDTIYPDKIIGIINGFNHGFPIEKIYPIPLKDNWFYQFGFKLEGDYFFSLDMGNRYCYVYMYDEYEDCFHMAFDVVKKGHRPIHELFVNIDCVHQLQNLYHALTGEELTVKTN